MKTLWWQLPVLSAGRCDANVSLTDGKKAVVWAALWPALFSPPGAFPGEESTFYIPEQDQELLPGPGWSDTQGQCFPRPSKSFHVHIPNVLVFFNKIILPIPAPSVEKTDPGRHPSPQRPGNISSHQSHRVIAWLGWSEQQFNYPSTLDLKPIFYFYKIVDGPKSSWTIRTMVWMFWWNTCRTHRAIPRE